MTKSKTTKRALIMSMISLLVCVSMLIGTTYAWFTDSVTSGGNTIQAGTLDIDLVDANGNSLAGQTIPFLKAAGHENETLLWEPGCTYQLAPVYVKNNGTLALKYKFSVIGIDGDASLLDVIDWTVNIGENENVDLTEFEGTLAPGGTAAVPFVLLGHMLEAAGNEYQNLTAEGIQIAVKATQATAEYDSFGNTYDADAVYPS